MISYYLQKRLGDFLWCPVGGAPAANHALTSDRCSSGAAPLRGKRFNTKFLAKLILHEVLNAPLRGSVNSWGFRLQNYHLCYWQRLDLLPISVSVNQTDTISRLLGPFSAFFSSLLLLHFEIQIAVWNVEVWFCRVKVNPTKIEPSKGSGSWRHTRARAWRLRVSQCCYISLFCS